MLVKVGTTNDEVQQEFRWAQTKEALPTQKFSKFMVWMEWCFFSWCKRTTWIILLITRLLASRINVLLPNLVKIQQFIPIGHVNVQSCPLIVFQYQLISLLCSWLSVEQPIRFWPSVAYLSLGCSNTVVDNLNVTMPDCMIVISFCYFQCLLSVYHCWLRSS